MGCLMSIATYLVVSRTPSPKTVICVRVPCVSGDMHGEGRSSLPLQAPSPTWFGGGAQEQSFRASHCLQPLRTWLAALRQWQEATSWLLLPNMEWHKFSLGMSGMWPRCIVCVAWDGDETLTCSPSEGSAEMPTLRISLLPSLDDCLGLQLEIQAQGKDSH